ncbi:hypothetical protein [Pseudomonas phage D6]|nr:hypothetical protein [Pseudomonas phage D6]
MTSSIIDPFSRVTGFNKTPTTKPNTKTDTFPVSNPKYATLVKSVNIENRTRMEIVAWDNLCIPYHLDPRSPDNPEVVRVEVSLKPCGSAKPDYLGMHELMQHVPPEMVDYIDKALKGQDLEHTQAVTAGTLYFYWDIPLEMLKRSPGGVHIEALGIVIRLAKHHKGAPIYPADYRPPAIVHTGEGIVASFNKIDYCIEGIWLNLKGTTTRFLCKNQNDPNQPEGLIIHSNGTERTYRIDELSANGFYMTEQDAAAARGETAAEIAQAQRAYQQQVDRDYERRIKEDQTIYDRRQNEEKLQREAENREYERRIKEAEREARELREALQLSREERAYNDQRTDKKEASTNVKRAAVLSLVQGAVGLLITGPKGIEAIIKIIDSLKGEK